MLGKRVSVIHGLSEVMVLMELLSDTAPSTCDGVNQCRPSEITNDRGKEVLFFFPLGNTLQVVSSTVQAKSVETPFHSLTIYIVHSH